MDREWPEDQRARFLAACPEYPELGGLHDLRTRTSGTHQFAQFHVWVPGRLDDRHRRTTGSIVSRMVAGSLPGTEILIHLDPEGHVGPRDLAAVAITEKAA